MCAANSQKHYSGACQPRCYGDVQRLTQATLKAGMRIVWDSGFLNYYAEPWCYGCQVVFSRDNTANCFYCDEVGETAWTSLDDIQEWVEYVFFAVRNNRQLDGGWSPCRSLVVNWSTAVTCKDLATASMFKDVHCYDVAYVLWKENAQLSLYYKAEPRAKDLAILPTSVGLYDARLLHRQASHLQTMHNLFMRRCKRAYQFKRMSWQRQKRHEFLAFMKSEEILWKETWKKCKTWRLLLAEMT
jgi:hypothetical protein